MKHWVAVQDMIQSDEIPSQEWLDEKIGIRSTIISCWRGYSLSSWMSNRIKSLNRLYPLLDFQSI
jgi:hypothetical protein